MPIIEGLKPSSDSLTNIAYFNKLLPILISCLNPITPIFLTFFIPNLLKSKINKKIIKLFFPKRK